MGYGGYSHEAHEAMARARVDLPIQKVFREKRCHPLMAPKGVKLRECRDSVEHPASLAILFALDVTGSMGAIPELLAKRELPRFMKTLLELGVPDPQVLFGAVGDAYSDDAPLQVGQFESTAELMDQWLTRCFLEGGGGQHGEESYELALYFAARHTAIDCWEKRKKRGYLFLTGDEKPYPRLSRAIVKEVVGDELDEDLPLAVVVDEVQRAYEPFFLIPDLERRKHCERPWRDVLGDRVICLESPNDVCEVAAGAIALAEGLVFDLDSLVDRLRLRIPAERVAPVARALMPFAASLRRDGTPEPVLGDDSLTL